MIEYKLEYDLVIHVYIQALKDYVDLKRSGKIYCERGINESCDHIRNWLINSEIASQLLENPETFMNEFDRLENQLWLEGKKIRFNRLLEGNV